MGGARMSDWRNPDDYAYTEDLTYPQWAWEFLRRSSTYRTLWNEYSEFVEREFEGKQAGDPVLMPIGFFARGERLGLENQLPGPEVPAHQIPDLKWSIGVMMKKVDDDDIPDHPAIRRFVFNLALPIEGQIQQMANELRLLKNEYDEAGYPSIAPPNVRVRKDLWRTYLRLLDAKLAGASIGEMGRVAYADTSDQRGNAQNALRRAEEFAESGYWQLLFMTDPNAPHLRPEEPPKRTYLVSIILGTDWEEHAAGEVIEVDSRRGEWLLANVPGSRLSE